MQTMVTPEQIGQGVPIRFTLEIKAPQMAGALDQAPTIVQVSLGKVGVTPDQIYQETQQVAQQLAELAYKELEAKFSGRQTTVFGQQRPWGQGQQAAAGGGSR